MNWEACFSLVWDFREKYGESWKTPDTLDSLRYAYSEMGEAYSEFLREKRSTDLRNRDKVPEFDEELADCAIMLITAVGNNPVPMNDAQKDKAISERIMNVVTIDRLSNFVAESLYEYAILDNKDSSGIIWDFYSYLALLMIDRMLSDRDCDLEDMIARKLAKIAERIEGSRDE